MPAAATPVQPAASSQVHLVARTVRARRAPRRVLRAARLERQLDARLAHVQGHRLAHVLEADEVRAGVGDEVEQLGKAARAVGDAREDRARGGPPRFRGGAAVPASRPLSTFPPDTIATVVPPIGRQATAQEGRHGHRPGALDDELGAFGQEHHRVGDLVLGDGHEVVEQLAKERQRELAGTLDRDAVGDRGTAGDLDRGRRSAALQRVHVGRAGARLNPHELDLRARRGAARCRRRWPDRRRRPAPPRARGRRRPRAARARACPGRRSRRGRRTGARTPRRCSSARAAASASASSTESPSR